MTEPTRAVFLSYASQDAEAARRICEALRSAGIEVWFDQSELRGGDAWDTAIRKQIKSCGLFIPVISQNTHARGEGYFRLEWKLAIDRSHLISSDLPFLLPVAIDDTRDDDERTPERFRDLQWTRLPGGETPPGFVDRVARLISPGDAPASDRVPTRNPSISLPPAAPVAPGKGWRLAPLLISAVVLLAVGYFAWDKFVLSKHSAVTLPSAPATNAIPEQSIAVLPFADMSEKKDQEYFSDGLTEQMIELLGQVPDLRVPARTSSFYFKGKNEPIASMAQQLKVAHVLEGSVRKAGNRLRITAQLIRADSGYHLWSQTFDRDDKDIFAVQDEIAQAVVSALKLKLAAAAQATGSRGTANTEAYNSYLLGRQLYRRISLENLLHAVEAYRKAIALDPNYAAAYAGLALAQARIGDLTGDTQGGIERAGQNADMAIALAPNDATGYATRSYIRSGWLWDWAGAMADIERALSLDPHDSEVQHRYALVLSSLSRLPEAIAAQKKAAELDPLSGGSWSNLGTIYAEAGNFAAADTALGRAIELEPTHMFALYNLAILRLLQGQAQEAIKVARNIEDDALRLTGIAMAEHTLGHAKESQLAMDELIAKHAQDAAYQIADVFAWRGEKDKAFAWLERAYRQRDGGLSDIKSDPLLNSLRADPRFNTMLRKLKLPE